MFKWLSGKFSTVADGAVASALLPLISRLAQMSDRELAVVLIFASEIRHKAQDEGGQSLADPRSAMAANPNLPLVIKQIETRLKLVWPGPIADASAIWLLTLEGLRPLAGPELQSLVTQLWRVLRRAFPTVPAIMSEMSEGNRSKFRVAGIDVIPVGAE